MGKTISQLAAAAGVGLDALLELERVSGAGSPASEKATVQQVLSLAPGKARLGWLPTASVPPNTNFATLDARNTHPVLDFDDTVQETAYFLGAMPSAYAGGNVSVTLWWAATTATSGNGGWDVTLERIAETAQDLDADGFATPKALSPAAVPGTSGQLRKSVATLTAGSADTDNLAAGEPFRLRVRRDTSVSGNAAGDLELWAVVLQEV